jgi:hypothetical protein
VDDREVELELVDEDDRPVVGVLMRLEERADSAEFEE